MVDPYYKSIVVFANSRKPQGSCVAGKDLSDGNWIRPVSSRPSGELSQVERRLLGSGDPSLLDTCKIAFRGPRAHTYQRENHVIDESFPWLARSKMSWLSAAELADDHPRTVWGSGASTRYGQNDKTPVEEVLGSQFSLLLLDVRDFEISVAVEWPDFGARRKVRGAFHSRGQRYVLSVTDPIVERRFLAGQDGSYSLGRALLCLSLGEPYKDHAHKLIAGVILPEAD